MIWKTSNQTKNQRKTRKKSSKIKLKSGDFQNQKMKKIQKAAPLKVILVIFFAKINYSIVCINLVDFDFIFILKAQMKRESRANKIMIHPAMKTRIPIANKYFDPLIFCSFLPKKKQNKNGKYFHLFDWFFRKRNI